MGYWENKIAVVTGGAHGIGRCITEEFSKKVITELGHVDFLIHNAPPFVVRLRGNQEFMRLY